MTSLAYKASQRPEILDALTDEELAQLEYDWEFWARPNQLEPDEFIRGLALIWLLLSGRGWGKTRTGAETVNKRVKDGRASRIALVGQSVADVRDVMVEGESGIVACSPPDFKAHYQASKRRVVWPNGAIATLYTAEDPDQLRGPQHDFAWCDEIAAWPRLTMEATWDNLMFGLRLGLAQCMITTTPRPIKIIKDLVKRSTTYITRGSTYENLQNLAETFKDQVVSVYEGTRLGRQELYAEILEDNPDALWTWTQLDRDRVADKPDSLIKVAVAIDPSGSSEGHEVGIVTGGLDFRGQGFLLGDNSVRGRPNDWAAEALKAYDLHDADCLVVETNYGGEMVSNTIKAYCDSEHRPCPKIVEVRASRGKAIRAQPISAYCEQGVIHHVGHFTHLEDQLCSWLPEDGPNDRLDAYVWLWTYLRPQRRSGRVWVAGAA